MKTKIILGMTVIVAMLSGCDVKEKERLQSSNDSLRVELNAAQQSMATLQEVGTLLDSIDANRAALRLTMVEGTNVQDYTARLKNINKYVGETEAKIASLEESLKKSNSSKSGYSATIKRLKTELEDANKQLAVLQEEGTKLRNENGVLISQVTVKDSVITEREQFIKVKEAELVTKEEEARTMSETARVEKADLFYQRAEALELVAKRTQFAPRKKKETKREALELYKIALSLGKTEAQLKIDELEKSIG
jgi:chromosome segregation ATPase